MLHMGEEAPESRVATSSFPAERLGAPLMLCEKTLILSWGMRLPVLCARKQSSPVASLAGVLWRLAKGTGWGGEGFLGGLRGHLLDLERLLLGGGVQLLGLRRGFGYSAQPVGVASGIGVEWGGGRRRLGHVIHALLGGHGSLG